MEQIFVGSGRGLQDLQFGGPVVTIKCHEDNSLVKACVDEAGAGRVIVVDGGGSIMDLPGYGYAKAPKHVRDQWGVMIENYLLEREGLDLLLDADAAFDDSLVQRDAIEDGAPA